MTFTTMRQFMEAYLKRRGFNVNKDMLKFSNENRKLGSIVTMSMPAGHSCPFAKDCRSCAIRNPRKRHDVGDRRKYIIQDGPETKYRCFTAIDEVLRPDVRKARWHNYLLLLAACKRGLPSVVDLIERSMIPAPFNTPTRPHVAGDFFNQMYFDAWMEVARRHPNRLFYAYTKALPFWVKRLKTIPRNFKLTASRGGTHDHLIERYGLRSAVVVSSVEEAKAMGLEIDHDDSHAYGTGGDFALLIHGQQPKGTMFAKVWKKMVDTGVAGYGKHKDKMITTISLFGRRGVAKRA